VTSGARAFPGNQRFLVAAFLLCVSIVSAVGAGHPFDAGVAGFTIKVRDLISPYRVLGIFVLPGEEVPISLEGSKGKESFSLEASAGTTRISGPGKWVWNLPENKGL
jgi:hypothetical protein